MELLGHNDIATTMIYTHVLARPDVRVVKRQVARGRRLALSFASLRFSPTELSVETLFYAGELWQIIRKPWLSRAKYRDKIPHTVNLTTRRISSKIHL